MEEQEWGIILVTEMKKDKDMAKENVCLKMEQYMMVNGKMIWDMDKEWIQIGKNDRYTMDHGLMIWNMVQELMMIQKHMVKLQEHGQKIVFMELHKKKPLMVLSTQWSMWMVH